MCWYTHSEIGNDCGDRERWTPMLQTVQYGTGLSDRNYSIRRLRFHKTNYILQITVERPVRAAGLFILVTPRILKEEAVTPSS